MPSMFGHSLWGMAAGAGWTKWPVSGRTLLLAWVCSVAADVDTLGFRLGIPYEHWLGHRGLFHGILFAVLLALAAAAASRPDPADRTHRIGLFQLFFFCAFTHIVLDAMTNGGLGVAFFAPFSNHRYFLPWRPLNSVPIGINQMLSRRWVPVIFKELRMLLLPSFILFAAGFIWRRIRSIRKKTKNPA